jgi:hypothetical protein
MHSEQTVLFCHYAECSYFEVPLTYIHLMILISFTVNTVVTKLQKNGQAVR